MDVLVKYKRLVNRGRSGRWDDRDAVTHAAYKGNGRVTMCGRGNPDADPSPTTCVSQRGWEFLPGRSIQAVTCFWCLKAIEANPNLRYR
jgi:hypothetical protein